MAEFARVLQGACVRDVMRMHVVTVVPEMTVRELAHALVESGLRSAPVLDPAGKVLGVVSQADVTGLAFGGPAAGGPGASAAGGGGRGSVAVRDVMRPAGLTVAPDDPLPGLIRRFLREGSSHALVVHHGMLVGIVTPMDLLRAIGSFL